MPGSTKCALVEPEYSEHTTAVLAELCRHRKHIAVLSAPSICSALDGAMRRRAAIFEFDPKWAGDGARPCFMRSAAQWREVEQDLTSRCDLVIAHIQRDEELVLDKYMQMVRLLAAPDGLIAVTSVVDHEVYLAMCGLFPQRFVPSFGVGHAWAAQWRLYTNFDHEFPDSEDGTDSSGDEAEKAESIACNWSFSCKCFQSDSEQDSSIDEAEGTAWQSEKPGSHRRFSWSVQERSTGV